MAIPLHLTKYTIENRTYALFEPDKEAISSSYQKGEIAFPYWSQVWPAAIGLSQFLVKNEHYTTNKKVLELAAGLGLPSVVAASSAASVVASDYMPEAVAAVQQTITYNQLLNMQSQLLDWTNLPADVLANVLLLSDVSYEEQLFAQQEKVIRSFLQNGTIVILSTPQRLVAKKAILPLLCFCVREEEIAVTCRQQASVVSLFVLRSFE